MNDVSISKETQGLISQLDGQLEIYKEYRVISNDQLKFAEEDLKKFNNIKKVLDTERKEATRPLDETKKKIMGWFASPVEKCDMIIEQIRKAVKNYLDLQAVQAAMEVEQQPVIDGLPAPIIPQATVDGRLFRRTWKAKIVDETKLPRKYLIPNMTLINSEVRLLKDKTDIPGVEAYEE